MNKCAYRQHRDVWFDYVGDGEISEQWSCLVRDDERCIGYCEKFQASDLDALKNDERMEDSNG